MSTVSLNDQLYRKTFEVAIAQGKSVEQFVQETLEQAVAQTAPKSLDIERSTRNDLPVMIVSDAASPIDLAKVRDAIEEHGF
jgi:hypothetical protein